MAFQKLHHRHPVYQATITILQHQSLANDPKTVSILKTLVGHGDPVIPSDLMEAIILYYLRHDMVQIWSDLIGVKCLNRDGKIKEIDLAYLDSYSHYYRPMIRELVSSKKLYKGINF